jgi:hypothetical protein
MGGLISRISVCHVSHRKPQILAGFIESQEKRPHLISPKIEKEEAPLSIVRR